MFTPLQGYKTYIASLVAVVGALAGALDGEMSWSAAMAVIAPAVIGAAVRHGISTSKAAIVEELLKALAKMADSAGQRTGAPLLAAMLGGALLLSACGTTSQVASQVANAAQSPAGQALVTMLASFSPGVSSVVAKINSGLALTQADKQMVCGAAAEANGAYQLFAPLLGVSKTDIATETAAMAAVDDACDGTTTDIASAVQTALKAYQDFTATLTSGGVPVTTAPPT